MRVARRKILRAIFPALLDRFERRLLVKLAADAKCSRSAIVRHLILKEIATQRIAIDGREPKKALARSGR